MVQTFKTTRNTTIEPIEWKKYTGEEIVVNTIIRKGNLF